jgi:hypothetical protein
MQVSYHWSGLQLASTPLLADVSNTFTCHSETRNTKKEYWDAAVVAVLADNFVSFTILFLCVRYFSSSVKVSL